MINFNHALILCSGFSGMLATELLSKYFAKVTLIERDNLVDEIR